MNKGHPLLDRSEQFFISPFMQQRICHVGQQQVFQEASQSLLELTGVDVGAKQIERVCHHYGGLLGEEQRREMDHGGKQGTKKEQDLHYAMVDGGMVLTREDKWKEMKLARVFKAEGMVRVSKDRGHIADSMYVAHLGGHDEFCRKVEHHLDAIAHKVFIADGAKWIWKWAQASYPEAVQILDFYHAKEHLCRFAKAAIADPRQRDAWITQQSDALMNDGVDRVIASIRDMDMGPPPQQDIKGPLIAYYQANRHRMRYGTYRKDGLLIGSGAMEASHRHVIQHRMKLSGQRWTMQGAQKMADLRVAFKSNRWDRLVNLVKLAA